MEHLYQIRVVEEKKELDERRARLDAFICSVAFMRLTPSEMELLHKQSDAMQEYSEILANRIALWCKPGAGDTSPEAGGSVPSAIEVQHEQKVR